MARLLADENVPLGLVTALRQMGHDVLRMQDLSDAVLGMEDPDVLQTAISQQRGVLTENAWDFVRLHSRDQNHQGIVTFTRDADIQALARRVDGKLTEQGELAGKLIRVRRPSIPG